MECWKCGTIWEPPANGKLSFRALCDECSAWLHACKNCKHYKPGMSNDCEVPDTEYVADREGGNFCEEFELLGQGPKKGEDVNEVSRRLFGEGDSKSLGEKDFEDLFKD